MRWLEKGKDAVLYELAETNYLIKYHLRTHKMHAHCRENRKVDSSEGVRIGDGASDVVQEPGLTLWVEATLGEIGQPVG